MPVSAGWVSRNVASAGMAWLGAAVGLDREQGLFRIEGMNGAWGGREIREGRGSRTDDDQLKNVAAIYELALREGRPPVKAVELELFCSRSHAGRLVGQARKTGLLKATVGADRSSTQVRSRESSGPVATTHDWRFPACRGNRQTMMVAVLIRFAYLAMTNAFAALRLLPRSDRDKDIEILDLRHQLTALQRNLNGHRVRFTPGRPGRKVPRPVR